MPIPSRLGAACAALSMVGLAACAADAPPERPSLSVGLQSVAGTPAAIEVWARDAAPLAVAELLSPDGTRIAATTLESTLPGNRRSVGRPEIGVGAAGGSSGNFGAGISIGLPIFSQPKPDSLIVSRAVIPVANPADFRSRWTAYRVRLLFGTPGRDSRDLTLPAPDPAAQ